MIPQENEVILMKCIYIALLQVIKELLIVRHIDGKTYRELCTDLGLKILLYYVCILLSDCQ